jgi:sialate O-acetylesterase
MSSRCRRVALLLSMLSILFFSASASAEVTLPNCFSDHMVLQREIKVPVWGTAAAGEKVTVKFRDQSQTATADAKGNWRVELAPLAAGGPDELTVAGSNTLTRKDVLVGEVWVGSGQSNMAGGYAQYLDDDPELGKIREAGPYEQVRALKSNGTWAVLSGTAAFNNTSALLTPFGIKLHQELKVPVGLMLGAVGGTPSGAWLSEKALQEDSAAQEKVAAYAKIYDDEVAKYERALPAYEKAIAAAKAAGKQARLPPAPGKPGKLRGDRAVGYLYDAHIRPFLGYGIRGVLWDQGESGTAIDGVDQYTLMGALIRGWRNEFNVGDFAFIYVQKPSGGGPAWDNTNPITSKGETFTALPKDIPVDGAYVENHVKIMDYPNVGMAISSDLGSGIHPANKSGYGRRAADVALGMTYGKPVEYYGPVYKDHKVEGDKVRVNFTHVGQGLAFKHGDKLQGFAVAGEDKKFYWADAVIDGDAVVVSSAEVKQPVAVRYAYASRRLWANLFNKDGLPAVTFRTDSW